MANPPFNVDRVDKERLKDDPRYPFGLPKNDNANYLWIQIFYSSLNETGRAGFVMANSAGDARGSELEIRVRGGYQLFRNIVFFLSRTKSASHCRRAPHSGVLTALPQSDKLQICGILETRRKNFRGSKNLESHKNKEDCPVRVTLSSSPWHP